MKGKKLYSLGHFQNHTRLKENFHTRLKFKHDTRLTHSDPNSHRTGLDRTRMNQANQTRMTQ